jgi:hypothetical protein
MPGRLTSMDCQDWPSRRPLRLGRLRAFPGSRNSHSYDRMVLRMMPYAVARQTIEAVRSGLLDPLTCRGPTLTSPSAVPPTPTTFDQNPRLHRWELSAKYPRSQPFAWCTRLMAFKLWRRPAKPSLRYFVYVSDAKLEMLFDQIPPKLRQRLSAEAKVDLKLASLTIKEAGQPAPTRMAKLIVVEHYIDRHHPVGTVQNPGRQYFRGTIPMRWGWLEDSYDSYNVAFFYGMRDGHAVFLAGSRYHVLGAQPLPANAGLFTGSVTPTIIEAIYKQVSQLRESDVGADEGLDEELDEDEFTSLPEVGDPAMGVLDCAFVDGEELQGPPQWMEFLAVPLIEGLMPEGTERPGTHAVLATPIYVAHAYPE